MNNLSIDSSALFYNSLIKTNRKQYQHNTVSLEMKQRRLVHSCGQIGNMYTRMMGCGGAIVEAAGHEVERGVGPASPSLAPGAHDRQCPDTGTRLSQKTQGWECRQISSLHSTQHYATGEFFFTENHAIGPKKIAHVFCMHMEKKHALCGKCCLYADIEQYLYVCFNCLTIPHKVARYS